MLMIVVLPFCSKGFMMYLGFSSFQCASPLFAHLLLLLRVTLTMSTAPRPCRTCRQDPAAVQHASQRSGCHSPALASLLW